MTDTEIIDSLKGDFKLFLQALWEEQGLLAEIGEENARSKLMQILFNKYGVK